jgi:hypothetical protein
MQVKKYDNTVCVLSLSGGGIMAGSAFGSVCEVKQFYTMTQGGHTRRNLKRRVFLRPPGGNKK